MLGVFKQFRQYQDLGPEVMDPFAGVFRLNRLLMYVVALSIVALLVQGYWLKRVALEASIHAFEIYPDGRASFIEDRQNRILPHDYEAKYVARQFVVLMYGWNGSTISDDLAESISLCTEALGHQLREEIAAAGLIDRIRARPGGVRSEVEFSRLEVLEHSRRNSRVAVTAHIRRYGLMQYEAEPFEERLVQVEVIMQAVKRSESFPNALEVVRIDQAQPLAVQTEVAR